MGVVWHPKNPHQALVYYSMNFIHAHVPLRCTIALNLAQCLSRIVCSNTPYVTLNCVFRVNNEKTPGTSPVNSLAAGKNFLLEAFK